MTSPVGYRSPDYSTTRTPPDLDEDPGTPVHAYEDTDDHWSSQHNTPPKSWTGEDFSRHVNKTPSPTPNDGKTPSPSLSQRMSSSPPPLGYEATRLAQALSYLSANPTVIVFLPGRVSSPCQEK